MLSLSLKQGEYIAIGDNVILQYNFTTGANRCRISIEAPREVSIVRGEVLERSGATRPDCVFDHPQRLNRDIRWDRSKAQTLTAMRKLLDMMDGQDSNVRTLRRQLNHMFPPPVERESESSMTEAEA